MSARKNFKSAKNYDEQGIPLSQIKLTIDNHFINDYSLNKVSDVINIDKNTTLAKSELFPKNKDHA